MTRSILLDCTAFHPSCSTGGVSIYKQEILPALDDEFHFRAFYKTIDQEALDSCGSAIESRHQYGGNMLLWRDKAVRDLAKQGAKGVWFPTQFSAWLPTLPSLVTIHDMAAYLAWRSFSPLAKVYMPSTLLASSIHAKKLLVISESSADDLNRLFPWTKSRTVVARHGLPSDVKNRSGEIGISRHQTDGPNTFLFLDGANPRKRLDLSLAAFQKLGWSNLKLVITGNAQAVKNRVETVLGFVPREIQFVGRLERHDLLDAFASADILLYPSDFEGFGFPLIEAMAFGTSCVSFPGNAEKEIGGKWALYADQPDVDSLVEAIQVALERCRDIPWQKSLVSHALGFTWDDSIAIHRAELANLIS